MSIGSKYHLLCFKKERKFKVGLEQVNESIIIFIFGWTISLNHWIWQQVSCAGPPQLRRKEIALELYLFSQWRFKWRAIFCVIISIRRSQRVILTPNVHFVWHVQSRPDTALWNVMLADWVHTFRAVWRSGHLRSTRTSTFPPVFPQKGLTERGIPFLSFS